jgi:hypothetical protein
VVHRVQGHLRAKMRVAHVGRLASYLGLLALSSLKEEAMLHIRFPGEHESILLYFHGNVTLLLRNTEFVTFPW